jgi:hypothetical protein
MDRQPGGGWRSTKHKHTAGNSNKMEISRLLFMAKTEISILF